MQIVSNEENGKRENCFELEVSDQVEKTMPSNVKRHGGLFVPFKIGIDQKLAAKAERAIRSGMDSKTVGSGKELSSSSRIVIEFLYNRMLVKQFGCQAISGLQSNIAFPKQTGRSIGSWVAENPGVDVAGDGSDSRADHDEPADSPVDFELFPATARAGSRSTST